MTNTYLQRIQTPLYRIGRRYRHTARSPVMFYSESAPQAFVDICLNSFDQKPGRNRLGQMLNRMSRRVT